MAQTKGISGSLECDVRPKAEAHPALNASKPQSKPQKHGLDSLYRFLSPEVRAWIRMRVGSGGRSTQDIEDIVQDVWLRVALSLNKYDPRKGHVRNWVYRITQRTLCDRLRRARAPVTGSETLEQLQDESLDVTTSDTLLPERLQARIKRLRPRDRDLIRICAIEGRPTTDAALELGMTSCAARKRWMRLRRFLSQVDRRDSS